MDFRDRLIAKPGQTLRLSAIDPGDHADLKRHQEGEPLLRQALSRITDLQERLYAEKEQALLIVLQGIDAAGKDGVCWHVITAMNPQGCVVSSFKQPTDIERRHDFLWRVHQKVPAHGEVGVFNRSHYEDVLVARVHDLVPKQVWEKRYEAINRFEHLLVENRTRVLKFFLYISKEEQLERFAKRLDDKDRQWKISAADYAERELWDDYIAAYEAMLSHCSTDHAPWYVIPANHKWFRNLAVANIVLRTLEDMKIEPPAPTVDIQAIRQKYHEALVEEEREEGR